MTTALLSLPTHQPILWFEDAAAADPARAGGKAAALATLARHRRVPDGFVVAGTPDADAVEAAYAELAARAGEDEPLVAVRSSATDEDGQSSSFAGQHETILGVRGIDELLAAITTCRASAHTDRALQYRRANGLARPSAPLPVLVQLLVPADAAAVVFSVNPVTRGGEVLVNAAFGLGESIVGGTVTPDLYVIERPGLEVLQRQISSKQVRTVLNEGTTVELPVPDELREQPSLTDAQVVEIAALAVELERTMGLPVDVECAYAGGQLYLLQCRPITTLRD